MNTKLFLAATIAAGITAAATIAVAAPLPAGTKLTITKTTDAAFVGPVPGCTNGSCFGMFLFSSLYAWTPLGPGTDGGLIIGKAQGSGGQEINGLLCPKGELTDVWYYGNNCGTFFTTPSDAGNVFDDASCYGSGCGSNTTPRRTDLAVWNTAWNGMIISMGSASGCNKTLLPACTADQVAGIFVKTWTIDSATTVPRTYRLTYSQVVPSVFTNYPFELVLAGKVMTGDPVPVVTVTPSNLTGVYGDPMPFTITVTDPDGPAAPTCRVGTPPTNGIVTLNGCTSGTYTADIGFIGVDCFTIIANDGISDSVPITVCVVILAPTPSATVTPTATPIFIPTNTPIISGYPTPTVTPTPTVIVDGCPLIYPVTRTTITGKQGHLSITVTGNIVSVNPNGKEIKICPTTTVTYEASTNTPNATVVCRVKSNTSRNKGHIKVNDHIQCTDKPVGNDKIHLKIKSGVNQKAM